MIRLLGNCHCEPTGFHHRSDILVQDVLARSIKVFRQFLNADGPNLTNALNQILQRVWILDSSWKSTDLSRKIDR